MSKRNSAGGVNTLFNYFGKSPSASKNTNDKESDNLENETPKKKGKRQFNHENDEEEIIKPVKRRRQVLHDSESDNEGESLHSSSKQKKNSKPKIEKQTKITKENNGKLSNNENEYICSQDSLDGHVWLHEKLKFLKPEFIKDKCGRKPTHPEYDSRTLYVPDDFIAKQTPAMRQWWEMKKNHYDCILFFKVGKFYELYHMDAMVGVNELGFSFMKGEFAHSGFPESAYWKMSSSLIDLGYKVARVEQTETPEAMNDRIRNSVGGSKASKVVRREICQITNRATRVQGLQDAEIKHPLPTYLLAVCEQWSSDRSEIEFGVCFIDTSIGTFHLGQFQDDTRYARLLTLIAEYPPAVILEERKRLSRETKSVLKTVLGDITMEPLTSESQFYSSTKTLNTLLNRDYFKKGENGEAKLPMAIQVMLNDDDSLNTTCRPEYDLAIRCLGACMWYLKECLLDIRLFTLGKFEIYCPSDVSVGDRKYLMLDSCSLISLNLLGINESLQTTLDYCCTPFGKRLLHQYICRPLCDITDIVNRQKAISELVNKQSDLIQAAREVLYTLPDLERHISKIHTLGNALQAKSHPDSRAIFYEEKSYSKRKIQEFVATLYGFEKAVSICEMFTDIKSDLLKQYTHKSPGGLFPDIAEKIAFFKDSFDHEEAEKEGKIIPQFGMDAEYDSTIDKINEINEKLTEYLESQSKFFGCKVTYHGTDKKRFQLDIPEVATHKVTRDYFLEGTKKGSKPSKRYTTNETKKLLAEMIAAETRKREVLQDLNRRIFEKFSAYYEEWCMTCRCLAVVDVIIALAEYTRRQNVDMCVPEVLPFDPSPKLIIKNGMYPYTRNVDNFVPNDTSLGIDDKAHILVLTGPNMGGKSTLMRQVALLTIMAQMGCHVPASSMSLTLVDRIFTRLGAHDDIIAGHSTFLTELREASAILKHATHNSLVFLDELGRGTSTFDGIAIATSYLHELISVQCRTVFSTHYYTLLDYFKGNSGIQLGHMAFKVESEEDDVSQETVTLMYKMVKGVCPKSFGFNAARLAGVPQFVTNRANNISQRLEMETQLRKNFYKIFCGDELNVTDVREILNTMIA